MYAIDKNSRKLDRLNMGGVYFDLIGSTESHDGCLTFDLRLISISRRSFSFSSSRSIAF